MDDAICRPFWEPYRDVRLCREFTASNLRDWLIREYVAWENNNPVDRFECYRTGGVWHVWNDTFSERLQARREGFVKTLNEEK